MGATTEQLWRSFFRGAPTIKTQSTNARFGGLTTFTLSASTVVVSTTVVDSDSVILLGANAGTDASSGMPRGIEVKSVNPGNAFILGTLDGQPSMRAMTVHWVLFKAS